MLDATPLDGKVAVVTGGGAGIGGATSRLLAEAGAVVVLNDIDAELAGEAASDIEGAGGRCVVVVGDIRLPEVVAELADVALDVGEGAVDVLVNNVGDFRPARRTFLDSDEEQWRAMYEINLEHVFRCTHALLPSMVERRSGAIVNLSTVEAIRGIPGNAVYSAFNAGVALFTRSLAIEVGKFGVRVNAIAPDLADTLQTPAEAMGGGADPDLIATWAPLGRFGQPVEYAKAILFLASDQSSYITGHLLPVDGGTIAASGWYGRPDGKGWTNRPGLHRARGA